MSLLKADIKVRNGLEIAVIGMAGRFPGAQDVDSFWQNICHGVESVIEYSEQELRARGIPQTLLDDPDYVKTNVPFENMDQFDASLFTYTPRDAELLDPQHRLFLECAWHALEHAGYIDVKSDDIPVGIYAGCGASVYLIKHLLSQTPLSERTTVADILSLMSANGSDSLVTRVAYKLNLKGPAVAVQTACSSSLTAIHMACQSLLSQECDMALGGGVSLNLLQQGGYLYRNGAIFSKDGHCRAFDSNATGTLLGSGAGIVVLKRLDDAIQDGDTIHAMIKASAVNNDGADKVGFTAPSVQGQTQVIQLAQSMAEVEPNTISYIEAHGTGTTLGDPVEIAALTTAFGAECQVQQCAIGSVKTNIGHLDTAAGVSGFIKTVMALKHKILPASLNYEKANPQIDFKNSPFYVNTKTKPWPDASSPRRAGVSAFGIGGTNVHIVLEEYIEKEKREAHELRPPMVPYVFPLSGQTEKSLDGNRNNLKQYLKTAELGSLEAISATLIYGRKHLSQRCITLATSVEKAVSNLESCLPNNFFHGKVMPEQAKIVFMFPGQGAQHIDMGRALYEHEATFKEIVDDCCQRLEIDLALDLRELLFPKPERREEATRLLAQTQYTQVALFVVEYALAKLWISWGIKPDTMVGHSIGEYVAACLAGVFTLADALHLIAMRGKLLQSLEAGAMLAVGLSESELQKLGPKGYDIAAVNAENLSVLSGSIESIELLEAELGKSGVMNKRLLVSHAFHSAMVDPILPAFREELNKVCLSAPSIPFISNLSGSWISADEVMDPDYWVRHVRGTVRFAEGVSELFKNENYVFLEVGPGQTLSGLVRHRHSSKQRHIFSSQEPAQKTIDSLMQMYRCLAQMWVVGIDIDASPLFKMERIKRIPLPLYAFDRQSYWVDPKDNQVADKQHVHVNSPTLSNYLYVPVWKKEPLETGATAIDESKSSVLLIGREDEFTAQLKATLSEKGCRVITVFATDSYKKINEDHFEICPTQESDFFQLWQDISHQKDLINHSCYIWSTDQQYPNGEIKPVIENEILSLIYLTRILGEKSDTPCQLSLITPPLDQFIGNEEVLPHKALLSGLCKVIPQEYKHIHCKIIDMQLPINKELSQEQVSQITDELVSQDTETLVAYRHCYRWVKRFEQIKQIPAKGSIKLKKEGVYLITGGLGGIGLQLAEYLSQQWHAKLILVSRNVHPEQEEKINALKGKGAEVLVCLVDITDKKQTQKVIDQAYHKFGLLNGIIHAAGVSQTSFINQIQATDICNSLAAKVQGTENIMQAIKEKTLDFVVFFSSLASDLGGIGKSLYAAANAYLDAVANTHVQKKYPWVLSINWDGWRDIGMAAQMQLPEHIGIKPEQGMVIFETVLSGKQYSQVLISSLSIEDRLSFTQDELVAWQDADSIARDIKNGYYRPELSVAYIEPQGELENNLVKIWTEILGIRGLGVEDNLFELGGDSLIAIQLLAKTKGIYGVDIKPADFFQNPTIMSLAFFIESNLIEQIEKTSEQSNRL